MRRASLLILLCLATSWPACLRAQETVVGVAAPLSDSFALLGTQLRDGARLAAAQSDIVAEVADTQCSPEGGQAAARALIEQNVSIVVGFLCTEAIETALPLFEEAGIPVITPGVRTATLTDQRDRTGWPVFRLAPRADAEHEAVADILTERWREELFAVVDDGTIYGRELAENLRAAAELRELEPVYVDTFRPQLDNQIGVAGLLRRSGATHVFVGGDRNDIAILARDAAGLDYDLTIAGGDVLRDETTGVPLRSGILMIGLPHWAGIAGEDVLAVISEAEIEPEGYTLPAYAAMQIAVQALAAADSEDVPLMEALSSNEFNTTLGTFRFDAKGDVTADFYRLFRFDGEKFVEAE